MDETNVAIEGRDILPEFETKVLAIDGMTCDKCVQTIEKALRSKEGVKDVRVDRQASTATVTFDPKKTNIPDLHDALLEKGYKPTRSAE